MKIKLTLAACMMLCAIGAATGQEMTVEQYANYLIGTYGKDAVVTDGVINGKKGTVDFIDIYPVMDPLTLISPLYLQLPGPPCTTIDEKVPPTGTPTYRWHWCVSTRIVNGRQYEAQRDYMKYSNGSYRFRDISHLLDCETPGDHDIIRTTTTTMLAKACHE